MLLFKHVSESSALDVIICVNKLWSFCITSLKLKKAASFKDQNNVILILIEPKNALRVRHIALGFIP